MKKIPCRISVGHHPPGYSKQRNCQMIAIHVPSFVGVYDTVWLYHTKDRGMIVVKPRVGFTKHKVQKKKGRITHNSRLKLGELKKCGLTDTFLVQNGDEYVFEFPK